MYKQYILVIKKYRDVSKGKFGVHCAHASLSATLDAGLRSVRFLDWYEGGKTQTKIVKVVNNLSALKKILDKAWNKYPASMIADTGTSGEVPAGIILMGAVGPITEEEAEELGILKLSNLR